MTADSGSPPRTPTDSPVAGRSVLVTGGAGAFGQAFVRRCLFDGAERVAIYSRGEAAQAAMQAAFAFADDRLRFFIGDVRDEYRIERACNGVDIVVHAAALKRVEKCEADPDEAVATNVTGSQFVARACIHNGVEKAVLLSTDKAAAPNTLYGATKLAAERLWVRSNVYAAGTRTRFSATRYGNVLGSTGSVVPVWRAQAKHGQAITITEPTMSRFWMSMGQAVDLVMLALEEMRGGETFVPKIKAAPISTLAWAVAPGADIVATGIRPGEKIHECLVTEEEARRTHDCGEFLVIEPEDRSWGDAASLPFPLVRTPFRYSSDAAEQFTADELRDMVAA